MNIDLLEHEPILRLSIFLGLLCLLGLAEILYPRRKVTLKNKGWRWLNNLALVILNSLVLRFLFPIAAVGIALYAEQQQWGLFNQLAWSTGFEIIVAILLLDMAIYWQHRIFHRVPWLWRLHRVHHTDAEYDLTTGLRFHPLEIVLSMLIKAGLIIVLGSSAIAVLLFEIILNSAAMFNHANIRLPLWLDAKLRWCIVTPDMHRVHHSTHSAEFNRNFGFNIPWWDYLFGSYHAQPHEGHEAMVIGQKNCRGADSRYVWRLLIQPFVKSK